MTRRAPPPPLPPPNDGTDLPKYGPGTAWGRWRDKPCPACGVVLQPSGHCATCGQPAWVHVVTGWNVATVLECRAIRCDPGGHVLIREKARIA